MWSAMWGEPVGGGREKRSSTSAEAREGGRLDWVPTDRLEAAGGRSWRGRSSLRGVRVCLRGGFCWSWWWSGEAGGGCFCRWVMERSATVVSRVEGCGGSIGDLEREESARRGSSCLEEVAVEAWPGLWWPPPGGVGVELGRVREDGEGGGRGDGRGRWSPEGDGAAVAFCGIGRTTWGVGWTRATFRGGGCLPEGSDTCGSSRGGPG